MKVKEKTLDVFTIPESELRDYFNRTEFDYSLVNGEIKEVELTDHGVEFTFFEYEFLEKHKWPSPAELKKLKAKGEAALNAIWNRVRNGEITSLKGVELAEKEPHSKGIRVFIFEEDYILRLIHKMRFPSFWGSFFKPEAWAEPSAYRKITKVELTDDGIEFTIMKVKVP